MKVLLPIKYITAVNRENTEDMPITLAIVEDVKEIATDLQEMINDEVDMECNKVYHNAEDAITFLSKFPVDIVLCDIGLPGKDGIEAIEKLSQNCPQTQFCMFTVFEDNERIFSSLKAGAKGYILKNSSPHLIVESLRELHHGGSPMNPEIARRVVDAFIQNSVSSGRQIDKNLPLTPREYELLELLSTGMLYKEIARELDITVGTVKQHIHKIYDKLQVNNRTEAINKLYIK